jgi:hypothetical protein
MKFNRKYRTEVTERCTERRSEQTDKKYGGNFLILAGREQKERTGTWYVPVGSWRERKEKDRTNLAPLLQSSIFSSSRIHIFNLEQIGNGSETFLRPALQLLSKTTS